MQKSRGSSRGVRSVGGNVQECTQELPAATRQVDATAPSWTALTLPLGLLATGRGPFGVWLRWTYQSGRDLLHGILYPAPLHDTPDARCHPVHLNGPAKAQSNPVRTAADVRLPYGIRTQGVLSAILLSGLPNGPPAAQHGRAKGHGRVLHRFGFQTGGDDAGAEDAGQACVLRSHQQQCGVLRLRPRQPNARGVLHGAVPSGGHAQPARIAGRSHRQGHPRRGQHVHVLTVRQKGPRGEASLLQETPPDSLLQHDALHVQHGHDAQGKGQHAL
uniref:(northern house mosquito) hypothetical protein n=1 Tax=Culex pipiens TaxID=7175 RepID=A0A8D8L4T4_CULPI